MITEMKDIFEAEGFEVSSYRGRGCWKNCFAVSISSDPINGFASLVQLLADRSENLKKFTDMLSLLYNIKYDNMGRNYILYWPDIEFEL
jgi:hypothetical protein